SFSGGGPVYIHRNAINGVPQKQMVYPATPYRCVQSGSAVGYRGYPTPPPPKFPAALMEAPHLPMKSPRRMGVGYPEYEIGWEYRMESVGPLQAVPTVWT